MAIAAHVTKYFRALHGPDPCPLPVCDAYQVGMERWTGFNWQPLTWYQPEEDRYKAWEQFQKRRDAEHLVTGFERVVIHGFIGDRWQLLYAHAVTGGK